MGSFRIRYQTIEFGQLDIHVRTLRDEQEFHDPDGVAEKLGISSASWSLFGVVWNSSRVLANLMVHQEVAGKRILEVGCGLGLASLVLNHRLADITATDYHPEAENFLKENVQLNEGRDIPFTRTGWADEVSDLGQFDLIIGSDVLYERRRVGLLSDFIDQHAKAQCEVILVDPGRGNHASFSRRMVSLGYQLSSELAPDAENLSQPFKGRVLRYSR